MRCSKCKEVFPLEFPRPAGQPEHVRAAEQHVAQPAEWLASAILDKALSSEMPKESSLPPLTPPKKRSSGLLWLVLLVLVAVGCVAAYETLPEFRAQVMALKDRVLGAKEPARPVAEEARSDEVLVLDNVTQSFYDNKNLGKLFVVKGYVVNRGDVARRNIHVEGAVIKDGKAVETRLQKAGVTLSATQLGVMTEAEIVAALEDEKEISLNNSYVKPQDRIPFTMVFVVNGASYDEYAVRVGTSEVVDAGTAVPQATPAVPAAPANEGAPDAPTAPAAPDAGNQPRDGQA